jgi:DNA uptake protein ComE-like DNA-binding protein
MGGVLNAKIAFLCADSLFIGAFPSTFVAMWKDYFTWTRRERLALLCVTALVAVLQLLLWTRREWMDLLPESMRRHYTEDRELEAYIDSVSAARAAPRSFAGKPKEERSVESGRSPVAAVPLHSFDPNRIDSASLRGWGLPVRVISNWMKYLRMGGCFRTAADLGRIYGMDPGLLRRLNPFLMFTAPNSPLRYDDQYGTRSTALAEQRFGSVGRKEGAAASETVVSPSVEKAEAGVLELNTVDSLRLLSIKGVGGVSAARILRYRTRLGGYYSADQLREISGLYPETVDRLSVVMHVDPSLVRPLAVNRSSLERLDGHPYLNFYQAKVLVELRKARGGVTSLEELRAFREFTEEDLARLKWYLNFDR